MRRLDHYRNTLILIHILSWHSGIKCLEIWKCNFLIFVFTRVTCGVWYCNFISDCHWLIANIEEDCYWLEEYMNICIQKSFRGSDQILICEWIYTKNLRQQKYVTVISPFINSTNPIILKFQVWRFIKRQYIWRGYYTTKSKWWSKAFKQVKYFFQI